MAKKTYFVSGCKICADEKMLKENHVVCCAMMDALFDKRRRLINSIKKVDQQLKEISEIAGIDVGDLNNPEY